MRMVHTGRASEASSTHRRHGSLRHPARRTRRHRLVRLAGRAGTTPRRGQQATRPGRGGDRHLPHGHPGLGHQEPGAGGHAGGSNAGPAGAAGEPPAQTVKNDLAAVWGARFSPSGEWLAHEGTGNLWLLHRDGGEPSMLAERSSSGRDLRIAFQSDEVLVVEEDGNFIWLAVPDGEQLRRVEGDRGRLLWPRGDGYFSFEGADGQGSIYWWPFGEGEGRLVGTMADWRAAAIEAHATAWESPEWSPEWSAIDIDSSGTWIAYSRKRAIFLRSLEAWNRPPLELGEHASNVTEIAFQTGGDPLAAIDVAGELKLWAGLERPGELLRTTGPRGCMASGSTPRVGCLRPTGSWTGRQRHDSGIWRRRRMQSPCRSRRRTRLFPTS